DLDQHRVEERLGALGLLVIDQQTDEMELDLLPKRVAVEPCGAEFAIDALGGLEHAAVVEVNAVPPQMLDREPVARFKMAPRRAGAFTEERVVLVEALDQRDRDSVRRVGCWRSPSDQRRGGGRHRRRARSFGAACYCFAASICSFSVLIDLLYSSTALFAAAAADDAWACCAVMNALTQSR